MQENGWANGNQVVPDLWGAGWGWSMNVSDFPQSVQQKPVVQ
eukprot:CAMPEP_0184732754 /NCGR_PEP_ID=MMETSP0314-20130426/55346_1 /TAXON_ID=38298 /ORGANISM="Rhodella maculata, Strain CCMP 736" /LENGTH=41 /DNA_ID= /DNA_START= /DNA_END= /DNA_ORIENTATION=